MAREAASMRRDWEPGLVGTVLLIEDDPLVLAYFRDVLDLHGMKSLSARTAAEGVALLESDQTIGVVLTDLMLPDTSGTGILTTLHPLIAQRPWIQAIVVTGQATVEVAVEAFRLDAVDFLRKPIVPEDLLAALDRAAERSSGMKARFAAGGAESIDEAVKVDLLARVVKARALRARIFGDGLFSDPVWDMLLDLSIARLLGKRIFVTSLCIASGVPMATALRRIDDLEAGGLVTRVRDQADARRIFVDLTDDGFAKMQVYLDRVGLSALIV
jgi:FixJ family two-component response regulator